MCEWWELNFAELVDANIEITAAVSPVPVPAALWLFSSGLIGLVGFSRTKKL